ncbi:MAG: hypothetical protein ACM4AI_09415 [Acidobacteriota bacterium]
MTRRRLTFLRVTQAAALINVLMAAPARTAPAAAAPPAAGDVIVNEYASDNDAHGNDFFELLILGDSVDLRGVRVTDNELIKGALNNGESVFVFGNDAFLSAVPRGTLVTVWTTASGVAADTVVNPAASDWRMVLLPGHGVSIGTDSLGGTLNAGLSNNGDSLYVYLPGPDGTSAGTDNVYLDFISWEDDDDAAAPAGLADLNLPSVADNAYYTGINAAGNDLPGGWVRYDAGPNGKPTPGEPNPTQNLGDLRKK